MPKSKRDKKISLTKTDKKGLALKQRIIDDVRECVTKFKSVYVFSYGSMRNEIMKGIREEWKPSRFFFGKNKVLAIALGRTKEDEVEDDIHKICKVLKSHSVLLFTDCKEKEVLKWCESHSYEDYARSGHKVKETITLHEGPLEQFSHAMEPHLRQLGLPTKLEKGVITLISDHIVCKKGSVLTPPQAKILEYLEMKLATFKLKVKAKWTRGKGFHSYVAEEEEEEGEEDEEEIGNEQDEDNECDVEMGSDNE